MEQYEWLIMIQNSEEYEGSIFRAKGTETEVKQILLQLINEDRRLYADSWEGGTKCIDDIISEEKFVALSNIKDRTITYTAYKQDDLEYVELNNYEKNQEAFVTTLIEQGCSAVEAYEILDQFATSSWRVKTEILAIYDSPKELGENYYNSAVGSLGNSFIENAIDFEALGEDLVENMDGYIQLENGKVLHIEN